MKCVRWVPLDHAFLSSSIKPDYHKVKSASPNMLKRIFNNYSSSPNGIGSESIVHEAEGRMGC